MLIVIWVLVAIVTAASGYGYVREILRTGAAQCDALLAEAANERGEDGAR